MTSLSARYHRFGEGVAQCKQYENGLAIGVPKHLIQMSTVFS
jgi:hypothetical protein